MFKGTVTSILSDGTMRYLLLLLAALGTPLTLYGQDRTYDEIPIMAPAVRYVQRMFGEGPPGQGPPAHPRTDFRLAAATYGIERPERRDRVGEFSQQRAPRKTPTQDLVLLGQLSAAVALDTVSVERAARDCQPYDVPRSIGGTDTITICRFTQIEGVLGASLPIISGDTAKVEIWSWMNYPQKYTPEVIVENLWEVTLVRQGTVWRAVSHRHANPWSS